MNTICTPKSIYKVEDRGSRFFCDGTKDLPDFRVVLYVDDVWSKEWDGLWTEQQANEIANILNNQLIYHSHWYTVAIIKPTKPIEVTQDET